MVGDLTEGAVVVLVSLQLRSMIYGGVEGKVGGYCMERR